MRKLCCFTCLRKEKKGGGGRERERNDINCLIPCSALCAICSLVARAAAPHFFFL
ncbi:hypothetical protein WI664_17555 [Vibrio cholerae]